MSNMINQLISNLWLHSVMQRRKEIKIKAKLGSDYNFYSRLSVHYKGPLYFIEERFTGKLPKRGSIRLINKISRILHIAILWEMVKIA